MTWNYPQRIFCLCALTVALAVSACGADPEVLAGDIASQPAVPTPTPTVAAVPSTAAVGGTSSAAPPTAAAASAPTATATPAPTPTPIPVEVTDLALPENIGIYRGATLELLGGQVMNAMPWLVNGEPATKADPDGRTFLTVTLGITNETARDFYHAPSDFLLTNAQGRSTAASALLDSRANPGDWRTAPRAFLELVVAFETDELVTDLSGWTLTYDKDGDVPEIIALDVGTPRPYPLGLALPDSSVTITENPTLAFANCDAVGLFEIELTEAYVELDPYYLDSLSQSASRSGRGFRWVIITADATNLTADIGYPCELSSDKISHYEVRLLANGRATVAEDSGNLGVRTGSIDRNATTELVYRFVVPVESTTLDLVWGDDETVIHSWQLDLPTIDGD